MILGKLGGYHSLYNRNHGKLGSMDFKVKIVSAISEEILLVDLPSYSVFQFARFLVFSILRDLTLVRGLFSLGFYLVKQVLISALVEVILVEVISTLISKLILA